MGRLYYRPLVQMGPVRPQAALGLAGGWGWFTQLEVLARDHAAQVIDAADAPADVIRRLTQPRAPILGLPLGARPQLMGILNVTPDSFSDGGRYVTPQAALAQAERMLAEGADLIDIGGESTRPGADFVPEEEECARILPAVRGLAGRVPISIDTRKAGVARAALAAGAGLVNDVAAMGYDADMARVTASAGAPICLMHAQGAPKDMQQSPSYANVVLDVYDFLEEKIALAEAANIPRAQIIVDPGIGFGKTLAHNLALLARLSLFHSLGCAILLGASRKRFIGTITGVEDAGARMAGSLGVALAGAAAGVQFLRVHDMAQTAQALALWRAATLGEAEQ